MKIDQTKAVTDGQILNTKRDIFSSIEIVRGSVRENYDKMQENKYSIDHIKDNFKRYDIIVHDYLHRIDILNGKFETLDQTKIDKDYLSKNILEMKRTLKDSEIKLRRILGISDEQWENFKDGTDFQLALELQKPLSFLNEKIFDHIQMTQYKKSVLNSRQEFVKMHRYSVAKYEYFSQGQQSGKQTPEVIQREKYLQILAELNDSIIKLSKNMPDSMLSQSPTKNRFRLSEVSDAKLLTKRLTMVDAEIKHYDLKGNGDQNNKDFDNSDSSGEGFKIRRGLKNRRNGSRQRNKSYQYGKKKKVNKCYSTVGVWRYKRLKIPHRKKTKKQSSSVKQLNHEEAIFSKEETEIMNKYKAQNLPEFVEKQVNRIVGPKKVSKHDKKNLSKDLTTRFAPMKSGTFKIDINDKPTENIISKIKSSKKKHKRDRSHSKKKKHKKHKHKSKHKEKERDNDKYTGIRKKLSITPEVTEDEPKIETKKEPKIESYHAQQDNNISKEPSANSKTTKQKHNDSKADAQNTSFNKEVAEDNSHSLDISGAESVRKSVDKSLHSHKNKTKSKKQRKPTMNKSRDNTSDAVDSQESKFNAQIPSLVNAKGQKKGSIEEKRVSSSRQSVSKIIANK